MNKYQIQINFLFFFQIFNVIPSEEINYKEIFINNFDNITYLELLNLTKPGINKNQKNKIKQVLQSYRNLIFTLQEENENINNFFEKQFNNENDKNKLKTIMTLMKPEKQKYINIIIHNNTNAPSSPVLRNVQIGKEKYILNALKDINQNKSSSPVLKRVPTGTEKYNFYALADVGKFLQNNN